LSPTMQRVSSFPFTPINKPPLSEELKKAVSENSDRIMEIEDGTELKEVNKNSQISEDVPTMKVIIKEFARQNIKEKENQPLTLLDSGGGRFAPTITYSRIRGCVCIYRC